MRPVRGNGDLKLVRGAPVRPPEAHGKQRSMTPRRLEAFSDGVFTIVVTLLAFDLKLPPVDDAHVLAAIAAMWPRWLAYFLSFGLVGVYWVAHHSMMEFVKRGDRRLLWHNLMVMMTVALIPFAASAFGSHPLSGGALLVYACCLSAVNLAGVALWTYAWKAGLTSEHMPAGFGPWVSRAHAMPVVFYLVAALIGQFWPVLGILGFVAVPLSFLIPNSAFSRRLTEAQAALYRGS